jgi:hypothetical protein
MPNDFNIGQFIDDELDEDDVVVEVTSPSGALVTLMTQEEGDHYNRIATRYMSDNSFKNISDLLELDRILVFEIAAYRASQWLTTGEDYKGRKVNNNDLQKSLDIFSREIRGIKKDLGIDKSTRDRDQGESVAEYVKHLGIRAKEFGVTRNKQAVSAITLLMELRGLITLYENSSDAERKEFNVRLEDIVSWLKERFTEFDEIDKALRENQQYWIRTEING